MGVVWVVGQKNKKKTMQFCKIACLVEAELLNMSVSKGVGCWQQCLSFLLTKNQTAALCGASLTI